MIRMILAGLVIAGAAASSVLGAGLLPLAGFATPVQAQPAPISDQDVSDAYIYLLGRALVIRQERMDREAPRAVWG